MRHKHEPGCRLPKMGKNAETQPPLYDRQGTFQRSRSKNWGPSWICGVTCWKPQPEPVEYASSIGRFLLVAATRSRPPPTSTWASDSRVDPRCNQLSVVSCVPSLRRCVRFLVLLIASAVDFEKRIRKRQIEHGVERPVLQVEWTITGVGEEANGSIRFRENSAKASGEIEVSE